MWAGLALIVVLALPAAARADGPLRVRGHAFVDARGRIVPLHGLFAVWKQPPLLPAARDDPADPNHPTFTDADADRVRDLGVNVVRLAWHWEALEPSPGIYDHAYLEAIAAVEAKLARRGVYTVLDSHQDQYNRLLGDKPGFPAWATVTDGSPLAPDPAAPGYAAWKFPLGYFQPATGHAFANLYANASVGGRGLADAFGAAWQVMARRFRGDPHVIGYDLVNEPFPGTAGSPSYDGSCASDAGCADYERTVSQPFQTRLARAIRTVDRRRPVFYEPTFFFNSGHPTGLAAAPSDVAPAGLSFHNQCSTRAAYQVTKDPALIAKGHVTCPPEEARTMRNADAAAARLGGPPLMTEVAPTADSDAEGLNCLLERADFFQTGFTFGLSWSGPDKELRRLTAESAPGGAAPFKEMVLARVFPRAVAGRSPSYAFDVRTGRFTLDYATRPRIRGRTRIVVPAVQYPAGYRVRVRGGFMTSRPGARTVAVARRPRAASVHVVIEPRAGDATARPTFPPCSLNPPG